MAIGRNEELGVTVNVDPDTIRRKGNQVKLWALLDFKSLQTVAGYSYLSSMQQREFDCAEERHRTLALTEFSGNMGSGKPIDSFSVATKWEPVSPGSINQGLWKFVCVKQ